MNFPAVTLRNSMECQEAIHAGTIIITVSITDIIIDSVGLSVYEFKHRKKYAQIYQE